MKKIATIVGLALLGLATANVAGAGGAIHLIPRAASAERNLTGETARRSMARGRIVFADHGLFEARGDGSHLRRLTEGMDHDPSWSPDATRIAFTRDDDTGTEIWTANADGRNSRVLVANRYSEHPRWSPSGRWIAYQFQTDYGSGGGKSDTTFDLRLMRPDGTGDRLLGRGGPCCSSAYATEHALGWAWSPDSKTIALVRTAGRHIDIYLVNVATGAARRLAPGQEPAWAPGGTRLAIARGDSFGYIQACAHGIAVVTLHGRSRQITDPPGNQCDSDPTWSRDGRLVAFVRASRGIYVVRPDGTGLRRVASGGGPLRWTGDGRLLFTSSGCVTSWVSATGRIACLAEGTGADWHS